MTGQFSYFYALVNGQDQQARIAHSETGYWFSNGCLGTLSMTQITERFFYIVKDLIEVIPNHTYINPLLINHIIKHLIRHIYTLT